MLIKIFIFMNVLFNLGYLITYICLGLLYLIGWKYKSFFLYFYKNYYFCIVFIKISIGELLKESSLEHEKQKELQQINKMK